MHAIVLYYSQSGETARIAGIFADALAAAGVDVATEEIRPDASYPYPWKSVVRFFDAMPDAVLGPLAGIVPLGVHPSDRFDLVVLAYPVWFLSPATPVQAFFESPHAALLRDTDVITISVSRAMWQRASLTMKRLLAGAGASHCDNIAVTHQGSPFATLISTPRALLSGKSNRLLGVFPKAGVAGTDLSRARHLASVVAGRLTAGHAAGTPFLRGEAAVMVNRRLVVPEVLAWHCFHASARVIRFFGTVHRGLRTAGVLGFAVFLVLLILLGLPLAIIGTLLATPVLGRQLNAYVARLAAPTGDTPAALNALERESTGPAAPDDRRNSKHIYGKSEN
jgi:hypothetical protein